mmetsp:Transcript_33416/g.80894  ORF Transcript_33416/g.80894 Transcript_33416/m.80894 type:complete len:204 (+) Transcript_33416:564-1175(+)
MVFKRIQVGSNSTRIQDGILWDNSNVGTQFCKTNLSSILAINLDASLGKLDNTEQSNHQGRLSSACASNNSNLASSRNTDIESLQYQWKTWSVPELGTLDFNGTARRPSLWKGRVYWCAAIAFCLQFSILLNTLDGDHVCLHIRSHTNTPVQTLGDTHGIRNCKSSKTSKYWISSGNNLLRDRAQTCKGNNQSSNQFQANGQP